MKLVFALSTMAILMVADATMYKATKYAGTACAGDPIEMEWTMADVCLDFRSLGMGYMKYSCSGDNAVATGYTDSGCTSVNTTFALPGLTITAGVFNPGSSCISMTGSTDSSKWTCAGQPSQVTYNFYSDAGCTIPGTYSIYTSLKEAIDVCEFDTTETSEKSEKTTVSGGVKTESKYASTDCTGTALSTETWDITTCQEMSTGSGVYVKQDAAGVLTAAQAQAAVSAGPAPAPPANTTNTTAAPKATTSGVSLPYSIIASVLSVVASAAASI